MATAHINAADGAFAETILLPGDPLRAKFIAETFLENAKEVTNVRGMLGYTGTYKGKPISVMGHGMGMPSVGIYAHELITQYGVKNLIRIGSCGSYQEDIKVRDVIAVMGASTDSNFVNQYNLDGHFSVIADYDLLTKSVEVAKEKGIDIKVGNVLSSDVFYSANRDGWKKWADMGILAVEMEAAALYMTANFLGAKAMCLLTVSDSLVTHEATTAEERQTTFTQMMDIALELA